MDDYKKAVEHLASTKMDNEFTNKGPVHAAIVLTNMLKNTENHIKFFSGEFNRAVSNDINFYCALEEYTKSGKELSLMLENIPCDAEKSDSLKLVLSLAKQVDSNVKVGIINHDDIKKLSSHFQSKKAFHFAVSDNIAFRVETEREDYKAVCNFNEPITAKKLSSIFDQYFKNATMINGAE